MRALGVWLLLLALGFGLHGRMVGMRQEFEDGDRGARAALFAIIAENYLENGLLATGAVPILNPQRVEPQHFRYYLNHPPGVGLLAWIGANLGGSHATALRFAFLPFSIGIVLLVYRLAHGRHPVARAAAGVTAALTPLAVYYGAFVNFEVPTLFFVLLTMHLFLRYLRRGRPKDRTRAMFAMVAAVGCDWIALLLPVALLAVLPLRKGGIVARAGAPERAPMRQAILLLCAGITVAALVRILYAVQVHRYGLPSDPDAIRVVPDVLNMTFLANGFAAGAFLDRLGMRLLDLVGWPLLAAAAVGFVLSAAAGFRRRLRDDDIAMLALLLLALANIFVLAVYADDHEYFLLYLIPPAALALGRLIDVVCGRAGPGRAAVAVSLVALLGAHQALTTYRLLDRRLTYDASALGWTLRQSIPGAHTLVFLPGSQGYLQIVASTDMYIDFARSPAEIESKKDLARLYGMTGRPVLFVMAGEGASGVTEGLRTHLETTYRRIRVGPFDAFDLGLL